MKRQLEKSNSRTMAASISNWAQALRKDDIRACFMDFQMEHRLEHFRTIKGVHFVNDSKATNVNAAWYALESIDGPVIWIAGGIDKGNDYSILRDVVSEKVKLLVIIGKNQQKFLTGFPQVKYRFSTSIQHAVHLATEEARSADTVLLSPACASFDWFDNYEDRGTKFKEAVLRV